MYKAIIYKLKENLFYLKDYDKFTKNDKAVLGLILSDNNYMYWNYEYNIESIICIIFQIKEINYFYCAVSPFYSAYKDKMEIVFGLRNFENLDLNL